MHFTGDLNLHRSLPIHLFPPSTLFFPISPFELQYCVQIVWKVTHGVFCFQHKPRRWLFLIQSTSSFVVLAGNCRSYMEYFEGKATHSSVLFNRHVQASSSSWSPYLLSLVSRGGWTDNTTSWLVRLFSFFSDRCMFTPFAIVESITAFTKQCHSSKKFLLYFSWKDEKMSIFEMNWICFLNMYRNWSV